MLGEGSHCLHLRTWGQAHQALRGSSKSYGLPWPDSVRPRMKEGASALFVNAWWNWVLRWPVIEFAWSLQSPGPSDRKGGGTVGEGIPATEYSSCPVVPAAGVTWASLKAPLVTTQYDSHNAAKWLKRANSSAKCCHFNCLKCDHLNFNSSVVIITLYFNGKFQILLVQNRTDCFVMPFAWEYNFQLHTEFKILLKCMFDVSPKCNLEKFFYAYIETYSNLLQTELLRIRKTRNTNANQHAIE